MNMIVFQMLIVLFGGMAIFLYGMYIASDGLKQAASKHLKVFLTTVTKNQFLGSLAGIVLAAVMQSSTAATVMVVGFVNAGIMTLRQAMGVMLGSAIGTTFTVQLIAFNITDYALVFVLIGVIIFLFAKTSYIKSVGSIFLGLGFVLYGMKLMNDSMVPLQSNPEFANWLLKMTSHLWLAIIVSIIITIIIQNSAATIAIAMSLSVSGSLSLEAAIAIVYGANIGTVVTALIASINSSKDAQRTAVAHAIFKLIGVLFFLPFSAFFASSLQLFGGGIERQIANAHTIFNIVNLIILLPFCNKFADWMVMLLPEKSPKLSYIKYLDKGSLNVPAIALMKTRKELVNMANRIEHEMLRHTPTLFELGQGELRERVFQEETKIDNVYQQIYHYVKQITENKLSNHESGESLKLLYINNSLEGISDVHQELTKSTSKLDNMDEQLFPEEKEGLFHLYKEVMESYRKTVEVLSENNNEIALEVINRSPMIMRIEKNLRYHHFKDSERMNSRLSAIYLDIINELLRMNQHLVSISQVQIGIV